MIAGDGYSALPTSKREANGLPVEVSMMSVSRPSSGHPRARGDQYSRASENELRRRAYWIVRSSRTMTA